MRIGQAMLHHTSLSNGRVKRIQALFYHLAATSRGRVPDWERQSPDWRASGIGPPPFT